VRRTAATNFLLDDPDVNRRSWRLAWSWHPLGRLNPVHAVVRWLGSSTPRTKAEDAFHGVEGRLDEVVQVPDLADCARWAEAKADAHGEAGIHGMAASFNHGTSNGFLPRLLPGGRKRRGPPAHLDGGNMTIGHPGSLGLVSMENPRHTAAKDAGCCMAALGPIRPFRTPVERAHLPEDRRRLLPTMLSPRGRRQGPASGSAPQSGSVSATGWTRGDSRATWTSRLLPELLPNQLTRVGSTADAPALASSATRSDLHRRCRTDLARHQRHGHEATFNPRAGAATCSSQTMRFPLRRCRTGRVFGAYGYDGPSWTGAYRRRRLWNEC
jgi:hypothetical protein